MSMETAPIWIAGEWRQATAQSTFQATNPATGEALSKRFPVSQWADCEAALAAAVLAQTQLRSQPSERIAAFLEAYAGGIEAAAPHIVAAASLETGLPIAPRLRDVELPRTANQLRQAADAAREQSWKQATLDKPRNIRSYLASIGPVLVFGPNNFPLAFNGISGGDFAAAIAAGNPVIAKAHPLHPETTRLLAEQAQIAATQTGMPAGTLQMLYAVGNDDGLRLVADSRIGAVAFTGSRAAGLRLKRAADEAGKPIYLEMSSINPVIFLPAALHGAEALLATELAESCLAASGQFCTSPNLILLWQGPSADVLLEAVAAIFRERAPQPLLSFAGLEQLDAGVAALVGAGAQWIAGGHRIETPEASGFRYANTLLRATATQVLAAPHALQREVFGNATMAVTVAGLAELEAILNLLEGNLTGSVYSAASGQDDEIYNRIEPLLRQKVGRLLNDKMPTGVAVSPAMQHGGPFPATSHPGFTSVGIPASIRRFAALQCYDGVREDRLPAILRDSIANAKTWRSIDGEWVRG